MLFLLDANVLIDANRDYYPIQMVPEFWEWLAVNGVNGNIAIPREIYEEIVGSSDDLSQWLQGGPIREALVLVEDVDPRAVAHVVSNGYAPDLTDDEIEKIGRDPFLLAYALVAPADRCVVTTERSKPSTVRANRHIPDVCDSLGLSHCHTFQLIRRLQFRTGQQGD